VLEAMVSNCLSLLLSTLEANFVSINFEIYLGSTTSQLLLAVITLWTTEKGSTAKNKRLGFKSQLCHLAFLYFNFQQ
jgi:integral membrane sensor domain MASE1